MKPIRYFSLKGTVLTRLIVHLLC